MQLWIDGHGRHKHCSSVGILRMNNKQIILVRQRAIQTEENLTTGQDSVLDTLQSDQFAGSP